MRANCFIKIIASIVRIRRLTTISAVTAWSACGQTNAQDSNPGWKGNIKRIESPVLMSEAVLKAMLNTVERLPAPEPESNGSTQTQPSTPSDVPPPEPPPTAAPSVLSQQEVAMPAITDEAVNEPFMTEADSRLAETKIAEYTPEIGQLIYSLKHDPVAIFRYVRDRIETEDFCISQKGAHVTLLCGSGGAYDKCALLVALLRGSGKTVAFFKFTRQIPVIAAEPFDLAAHLGYVIDRSALVNEEARKQKAEAPIAGGSSLSARVYQHLLDRGWSLAGGGPNYINVTRLVVGMKVSGQAPNEDWIYLDPAFPAVSFLPSLLEHDQSPFNSPVGESLSHKMGYDRQSLLSALGGSFTGSWPEGIKSVNETELKKKLSGYSLALTQHFLGGAGTLRSLGDRHLTMQQLLAGRIEVNHDVETLQDLRVFGCPWLRVSGAGAAPSMHWSIPREFYQVLLLSGGQLTNGGSDSSAVRSWEKSMRIVVPALQGRSLVIEKGSSDGIETARVAVGDKYYECWTTLSDIANSKTHFGLETWSGLNTTNPSSIANKIHAFELKAGTKHVINYLNVVSRRLLNEQNRILQQKLEIGDYHMREEQMLHVLALNWVYQVNNVNKLIGRRLGLSPQSYLAIGQAGTSALGAFVDFPMLVDGSIATGETDNSDSYLQAASLVDSALERSVIEQMLSSSAAGVSTTRAIRRQNQLGKYNYIVGQEINMNDGVWGWFGRKLSGYSYSEFNASIRTGLIGWDAGAMAVIPQSAKIPLGAKWNNSGYMVGSSYSVAMKIGGGLFGGAQVGGAVDPYYFTTNATTAADFDLTQRMTNWRNGRVYAGALNAASSDPIDMRTGGYFYDHSDINRGCYPNLTFDRHYSSDRRENKEAGMGYGWTHNHFIQCLERTDVDGILGQVRPEDAAPALAVAWVVVDLVSYARSLCQDLLVDSSLAWTLNKEDLRNRAKAMMGAVLAAEWLADMLSKNSAVVIEGKSSLEFAKLPPAEGQPANETRYLSPPGAQHLTLVKKPLIGSTVPVFQLTRRHEGLTLFDAKGRCSKVLDAIGHALTYTWDGNKLLKVKSSKVGFPDAHNFWLTFGYDIKNRLTSIKNEKGKLLCSYEYAGESEPYEMTGAYISRLSGPLPQPSKWLSSGSLTPPSSGTGRWIYKYVAEVPSNKKHCMTEIIDPEGGTVVRNDYWVSTVWGAAKVFQQWSMGGNNNRWRYEWGWGLGQNIEHDPLGGKTIYYYDDSGRLVGIRDAEDNLTEYVHDSDNHVVLELKPKKGISKLLEAKSIADIDLHQLRQEGRDYIRRYYLPNGLLHSVTETRSWNASTTTNETGHITGMVADEPADKETFFEYDPETLMLTKVTDSREGETKYTYRATPLVALAPASPPAYKPLSIGKWLVETVTDPENRVTRYEYADLSGIPWWTTLPSGAAHVRQGNWSSDALPYGRHIHTELSYGSGLPSSSTSLINFDWDELGGFESERVNFGVGESQRISRAASYPMGGGRIVTTIISASSASSPALSTQTTVQKFDRSGLLVETTDAMGNKTRYTHDAMGKIGTTTLPMTDAGEHRISNEYDERGWLKYTTYPHGVKTTYTRRKLDRVDEVSDSLSQKVKTEYDDLGRVTAVRDPLYTGADGADTHEHSLRTTYLGSTGLALTVQDALGQIYSQAYDAAGNRVQLVNQRGKPWLFAYDKLNRLVATNTPSNRVFRQEWHPQRNALSKVVKPSGQETLFTDFDGADRVLTKVDAVGTTQYQYDGMGRLSEVSEPGKGTYTRHYNGLGRLTKLEYINGSVSETLDFEYDANGNLTALIYPEEAPFTVIPQGQSPLVFNLPRRKVSYTYDSHNRLKTVTDWRGRVTTYTYDLGGRLTYVTLPNTAIRAMKYDNASRLTEIKDAWPNGRLISLHRYQHNKASHLEKRFAVPFEYGKGPELTATYDDENRIATIDGTALPANAYDLDGNLLQAPDPWRGGSFDLHYNARNQLTSASANGMNASYTYDVEGNRRTVTQGGQTTTYAVNPQASLSQVLRTTRADGTRTWHVYGLGLLYDVTPSTTAVEMAAQEMSIAMQVPAESIQYYHYDQVGNTVALTNQTKQDVMWFQYDIYGALLKAEPREGCPASISGLTDALARATALTPFLYVGSQGVMTDPNGLLHMRARYYSPGLRRFLNEDPIGFEGGMNWFAYAGGNPLIASDPSGLATAWPSTSVGILGPSSSDYSSPAFMKAYNGEMEKAGPVVAGVEVGIVGAAAVVIAAPAAVSILTYLGVSETVATGVVTVGITAGAVKGTYNTAQSTINAVNNGDWQTVSFNAGTMIGGLATGGMLAGSRGPGLEFSHWIPNRMGGPRTILNGNYVDIVTHALSDPYRARMMGAAWNQANPPPSFLSQQWTRFPNIYKGVMGAEATQSFSSNGATPCASH